MKKEGIQTRNRKLSSKTKRHRRNGENGNPRHVAVSSSLLYDHKPPYHGFPSSSPISGFPGSFPGHHPPPPPPPSIVHSHQIPSYMIAGGSGAAGSLSESLMSAQTHAFAQNSVNTGYPGAFSSSLQGGCSSGFGSYFGNGFVGLGGSARFGITSAPTNPC